MKRLIPKYKKYPIFDWPYIMDQVEDNVRSRIIFPLVALLLYVLMVFTIADSLVLVSF